MSVNFEQLFEESFSKRTLRPGDLLSAEILKIDKKKGYVLVDGGLPCKSESIIPIEEFFAIPKLDTDSASIEPVVTSEHADSRQL